MQQRYHSLHLIILTKICGRYSHIRPLCRWGLEYADFSQRVIKTPFKKWGALRLRLSCSGEARGLEIEEYLFIAITSRSTL